MRITWSRMQVRLAGNFQTSQARRTDKQTIWVKITHHAHEGWGEAVPMDTYKQTLESCESTLFEIATLLANADPFDLESITGNLLARYDSQRATVAAIDAALHDWIGKRLNCPTYRLLGLPREPIPLTSFSIGAPTLDDLKKALEIAVSYPILKIKLGMGIDEQTLATVRKLAPNKTIRVDANMAWTVDEAIGKLLMLREFGVEFVEQPLQPKDLPGLRRIREAGICPIVADESCVRPADVLSLAGCVDGINVKLSKCGGIREAYRMIILARSLGMRVMLGCMIESSLGISAALQLAPLADWLDLDGHLLLSEEPFYGTGGEEGKLQLTPTSGLGAQLRNP